MRSTAVRFVERVGVERVGFLTLTFADNVQDAREASRRFNSLAARQLPKMFKGGVKVIERTKAGRIHFHALVDCGEDIRTGVDLDAFERGDYRSAGKRLRSLWAWLRQTLPRYSFGRSELLPVRSTSEAVSRYASKYIAKHIGEREERDKGVRLWSAFGSARAGASTSRFTWNQLQGEVKQGPDGELYHTRPCQRWQYREWVGRFARALGIQTGDTESLQRLFGKRWAWHLGQDVRAFEADPAQGGKTFLARVVSAGMEAGGRRGPGPVVVLLQELRAESASSRPAVQAALAAFGGRVVAVEDERRIIARDWRGRPWCLSDRAVPSSV